MVKQSYFISFYETAKIGMLESLHTSNNFLIQKGGENHTKIKRKGVELIIYNIIYLLMEHQINK